MTEEKISRKIKFKKYENELIIIILNIKYLVNMSVAVAMIKASFFKQ